MVVAVGEAGLNLVKSIGNKLNHYSIAAFLGQTYEDVSKYRCSSHYVIDISE